MEIAFFQRGIDPKAERVFEESKHCLRRFLAAMLPLVLDQTDGFLQPLPMLLLDFQ